MTRSRVIRWPSGKGEVRTNVKRREAPTETFFVARGHIFPSFFKKNKIFIDFWLGRIHGWPGIIPNFVLGNFWKKSVVIIRDVFHHVNRLSFEPISSEKKINQLQAHRNDRWISKSRQKHWDYRSKIEICVIKLCSF